MFQNAISNHEEGLTMLTKMPYNFDIIFQIICQLEKFIEERPSLIGLDTFQFYRSFELGVYRVAVFILNSEKVE